MRQLAFIQTLNSHQNPGLHLLHQLLSLYHITSTDTDTVQAIRDAPFDIWGGGPRLKLKKIVCPHKRQKKKVVENVSKKKLLSNLMKNMLTRKNTKWYYVHNRESIRQKISST